MIGVQVAQQLREAGLAWKPEPGDRFTIPGHDLDDEVFVLSNMTIEVYQVPQGRVIGFNGTTEWALDDVGIEEALWLPREDQLRELLGGTFASLRRTPEGFVVETSGTYTAPTAEEAYAAALLALLGEVFE